LRLCGGQLWGGMEEGERTGHEARGGDAEDLGEADGEGDGLVGNVETHFERGA
jgi:hypothetical protein